MRSSDDEAPWSCFLDLTARAGARLGEPSGYVLSYEGRLLAGEDGELPIGTMSIQVVDLFEAADDGVSPWDVLDSVDAALAHFCDLISSKSGKLTRSVVRHSKTELCRILILDRLEIEEPHRRQGMGLAAIEIACSRFSAGAALAALRAFPTQWEGRVDEGPKEFKRDQAKLVKYYKRAGFKPIIGNGIMVRGLPGSP